MEIRDGWDDLGGDRFNKGNSYSVFTGDNNGLSHFALPGGCPAAIPADFDRSQCDFRIGNAGRNIVTGTPLRWTTVSAQKNFQFNEALEGSTCAGICRMRSRRSTSILPIRPLISAIRRISAKSRAIRPRLPSAASR